MTRLWRDIYSHIERASLGWVPSLILPVAILISMSCTLDNSILGEYGSGSGGTYDPLQILVGSKTVRVGQSTSLQGLGGKPPYEISVQSGSGQVAGGGAIYNSLGSGLVTLSMSDSRGESTTLELQNYQAGDLNYFWGLEQGKSRVDDHGGYDNIRKMVLDDQDRLVVVGLVSVGENNQGFYVARYNTDKSLDTTFADQGIFVFEFNTSGAAQELAWAIDFQSDNKIIVGGKGHNGTDSDFGLFRLTTEGALDTSFGSSGSVLTDFGNGDDELYDLVVLSNDKIVAVGVGQGVGDRDVAAAQYLADGSLDTTNFGTGGKALIDYSGNDDAHALVVDGSGRIIFGGSLDGNGNGQDFLVGRLTTAGAIDVGFNTVGSNNYDFVGNTDVIKDMFLQSDGKIVVGGEAFMNPGPGHRYGVGRLLVTGAWDVAFGGGGTGVNSDGYGNFDYLRAMIPLGDDSFLGVGTGWGPGGTNMMATKYTALGVIDTTWGASGFFNQDGAGEEEAFAGVLWPDGTFLLGGYSDDNDSYTNDESTIYHLDASGARTTSYGGDGILVEKSFSSAENYFGQMILLSNGKILSAGYTQTNQRDIYLSMLTPEGQLDVGFGLGGVVVQNEADNLEQGWDVVVQSTGKIVVGGGGWGPVGGSNMRVSRFNSDGTWDTTYGAESGRTSYDHGSSEDGNSIVILGDDSVVLGGCTTFGGSGMDFLIAKFDAAGSLDTGFGVSSGATLTAVNPTNPDCIYDLALQADGKIVGVGHSNYSDFALVRYLGTGLLDTVGFGTGGIEVVDVNNNEWANASALQADGKLVVVGTSGGNLATLDLAVLRRDTDGSVDVSFGGGDGVATKDVATNNDEAFGVAVDSLGRIVVVGTSDNGADTDIVVWRLLGDGTDDTSFGTGGVKVIDLGDNEEGGSIAIASDGSYLIGASIDQIRSQKDVIVLKIMD